MDQQCGFDLARVGRRQRAQFVHQRFEQALGGLGPGDRIADAFVGMHAARERAQVEPDHGGLQPGHRGGDNCLGVGHSGVRLHALFSGRSDAMR